MIELSQLTKTFGPKVAVDNLSVTVRPGQVTGFLGPNGAREVDHHAHDHRPGPAGSR